MGPISLTQVTPTPSLVQGQAASVPVDVAIYNGTSTVGLTVTVAQELRQKMPTVTVVSRTDAKNSYTSTLIVDQTGKNASTAAALAKILNGNVGTLPAGEAKASKADILVILGKK